MINTMKMPLVMGILMGAMILMMLHGFLGGETSVLNWGTLAFLGAHVLVALVVFAIVTFGLTRFPKIAEFATKLHRPSRRHVAIMLSSAGVTAFFIHLLVHGGL